MMKIKSLLHLIGLHEGALLPIGPIPFTQPVAAALERWFVARPVLRSAAALSWLPFARVTLRLIALAALVALSSGPVHAQRSDVTRPGDLIIASSGNSPGSEGAANAIDNQLAKYLNFDSGRDGTNAGFSPSGFVVTPSVGITHVTGLSMTSANDAQERDPSDVTLEGSNDDTISSFTSGNWQPIARLNNYSLWTARFEKLTLFFSNNEPYKHYRWTVNATRTTPNGCCMQIAEVELLGVLPPVLTCATNKTVQCGTAWMFDNPTATGGCNTNLFITIVNTVISGDCPQLVTRTWQAIDGCSNSATCSQTVTVVDTTPPILTCASNKTVECGSGWTFYMPTAIDDCCGTNVTLIFGTVTNGICPQYITRTWTATDCCSNSTTCTQMVTVMDTTPPAINSASCATNHTEAGTLNDDFNGPESASPSAGLLTRLQGNFFKGFDNCALDRVVAHTFTNLPPCITEATLCVRLKPCGSSDNDAFGLSFTGTNGTLVPGAGSWSRFIGADNSQPGLLTNHWNASSVTNGQTFCLDLSLLPLAGGGKTNLLPYLSANGFLDFILQDDTTVDFLALDIKSCCCSTNKTVECGTAWTFDPPAVTDACCTNVTVAVLSTVTNVSVGSQLITRTWQVIDCCSNSAVCSQMVTVLDTTPPVIDCCCDIGVHCGSSWTFIMPTAYDQGCGTNVTIIVLNTVTNGTCPRFISRTWQATDDYGNSATCSQTVAVVDFTAPLLTCANDKTVECGTVWTFDPPSAIDDCCGTNITVIVLSTITNGTCPHFITRTWQATDCCTNVSSCTQTVAVVDTTPPVFTNCPPATLDLGCNPVSIPDCDPNVRAIDNCELATTTAHGYLLVSSGFTDQVKRYDGTTGAFIDNFASGSGLDGPFDLVFGPDANLYVSSGYSDEVKRYHGTAGTFMNNFVSAVSGGLLAPAGLRFGPDANLYVVSYLSDEVKRYHGTTGAFMNNFVSTGSGGLGGPGSLVFGPDANLYVSSTTHEVKRYHGTSGTFMNTFVSAGSGGLNYPVGMVFGPDSNLYVSSAYSDEVKRYHGTTGAFMNNFVSAGSGGLSKPVGLVFGPDGNLYVSSEGTDQVKRYNGTTGMFMDNFASGGGLDGPACLTFTPFVPPSQVTCSKVDTTNGCVHARTLTYTATDSCGNSNTCVQVITWKVDTTPPVILCTQFGVPCGTPWSFNPPHAFDDGCGTNVTVTALSTVTNGTCPIFVSRAWQATDSCGNSAICTQTVAVVDFTPPLLTCTNDKTVACGAVWAFDPPSAVDNCCGTHFTIIVLSTVTNGPCVQFTRTWQATDCCTNISTCSQTVTVVDTTPPIITCPGPIKRIICGSSVDVNYKVIATDDCDQSVVIVCTPPSGSLFNVGTTNVTCHATNDCGLTDTCSFTVTVVDKGIWELFPAGVEDCFKSPYDPTLRSPCLAAAHPSAHWRLFDSRGILPTRNFGHSWLALPSGITAANVTTKMLPSAWFVDGMHLLGVPDNDTISFGLNVCSPSMWLWNERIGSPGGLLNQTWLKQAGCGTKFVFDLQAMPITGADLLPLMNSTHQLDMFVQNETAVDYAWLWLSRCPPLDIIGGLELSLTNAQLVYAPAAWCIVKKPGSVNLSATLHLGAASGVSLSFENLTFAPATNGVNMPPELRVALGDIPANGPEIDPPDAAFLLAVNTNGTVSLLLGQSLPGVTNVDVLTFSNGVVMASNTLPATTGAELVRFPPSLSLKKITAGKGGGISLFFADEFVIRVKPQPALSAAAPLSTLTLAAEGFEQISLGNPEIRILDIVDPADGQHDDYASVSGDALARVENGQLTLSALDPAGTDSIGFDVRLGSPTNEFRALIPTSFGQFAPVPSNATLTVVSIVDPMDGQHDDYFSVRYVYEGTNAWALAAAHNGAALPLALVEVWNDSVLVAGVSNPTSVVVSELPQVYWPSTTWRVDADICHRFPYPTLVTVQINGADYLGNELRLLTATETPITAFAGLRVETVGAEALLLSGLEGGPASYRLEPAVLAAGVITFGWSGPGQPALESAPAIQGPWTPVPIPPGVHSLTVPPTGVARFFRVRGN